MVDALVSCDVDVPVGGFPEDVHLYQQSTPAVWPGFFLRYSGIGRYTETLQRDASVLERDVRMHYLQTYGL